MGSINQEQKIKMKGENLLLFNYHGTNLKIESSVSFNVSGKDRAADFDKVTIEYRWAMIQGVEMRPKVAEKR